MTKFVQETILTGSPFDEEKPPTSWQDYYNHSQHLDPRIDTINDISYGIIAPIIITTGMIGNILTIYILKLPQFRGVTYTYFLMLAVSDLVSLVFSASVFYHLVHETTLQYSTAVWYSYFEPFFVNVFLSTSIFIVICITVDRYYSVCRPVAFRGIHNHRHARNMMVIALSLSIIVWLPICFVKTPKEVDECDYVYSVPPDNQTRWVACMEIPEIPTQEWYFIYSWARQTVVTFIPILLLVVLNTLTLRGFISVKRHKRELARKSIFIIAVTDVSQSLVAKSQSDLNLIKLLTALMITFFLTMVPVGIFNAIYTESRSDNFNYQSISVIESIQLLSGAYLVEVPYLDHLGCDGNVEVEMNGGFSHSPFFIETCHQL
ncbi:hypothetical protein SK128_028402 [Halocaridina rubra]|uniref:G-protein coupled receptors family 1 profile domain-containing protein n=1 Tax=Halocaridina rubra TaxID=373956 RepID=A0AAN8ZNI8_HALRR